jgi:hypothetical protein
MIRSLLYRLAGKTSVKSKPPAWVDRFDGLTENASGGRCYPELSNRKGLPASHQAARLAQASSSTLYMELASEATYSKVIQGW